MQEFPKTITLKDSRSILIRPLGRDDSDRLSRFFVALPEQDRVYLRHDVRDPELIDEWMKRLDSPTDITLVALDGDTAVATGRLEMVGHGWMKHVGHVRVITARSHRHQGLGGLLMKELVNLAVARNLEKLQVQVIEENLGAIRMCEAVGFEVAAVLQHMVKDQTGRPQNLAIMVSDVANLGRTMEDWFQDSMVPAYRVPGGGA